MDPASTPSGRKRASVIADDIAATPSSLKKRRLDDAAAARSPLLPNAPNPTASVAPSADGCSKPSNPPAPAPASAPSKFRPAIKLAALRGTIWDTGDERKPTLPKKVGPGRPPKPTTHGKVGRPPGSGKGRGRKPKAQREDDTENINVGDEYSMEELSSVGQLQAPRAKASPAKRHVASSPIKGILTPSKRGRPKGSKNVSFRAGRDSLAGEVFFEDLPKAPSAKKAQQSRQLQVYQPDEDEIVCEICSRPDSKAPNQIILCDNCDFAVHQECYEVPEIPTGDWLCKSCAQEDVLKTLKKAEETDNTLDVAAAADAASETAPPAAATPAAAAAPVAVAPVVAKAVVAPEVPNLPNLDHHLRSLQRVLLDRCTGQRRIKMFGQDETYEKVHQLVEQTVLAGEGNSMLLIGARGCGKTTLLEGIISDLSQEHRHAFHVVRLNGFIHTDDKLALKEIWRQLGKEMEVEDDLVNRTNYADTMASLLALLSHPSEIMGTDEGVTSQSIIFIIDEFDMFASHPRQTLLYNLFDTAQSRKAPIAVLGCTTRLDVVEMLEKRVKSRFSHRYVHLTMPRTLPTYWQVCRQGLVVEADDAKREGIDTMVEGHGEFFKYWNHKVEELYKQRAFQDLLQYHYYTTKSPSAFFTEWILPLSSLSSKDLRLEAPAVDVELESLNAPDSRLHLLSSLSELDIGLLIAAARLDIVAHTDTVNFAMAYDEYSALMGKQRVQSATSGMMAVGGGVRVWSRGVAGIAWERLISLELLVPAGIGGGRSLGHGGLESKMWKVDVALEEIPSAVKLSTVLARWCREI